jgi:hypothetical protein
MKVLAFSTGSAQSRQGISAGHTSGSSASVGLDKAFVISAANILQALLCLSNLTRAEAGDPSKVLAYASLTEEKLRALGELMRPMLWRS